MKKTALLLAATGAAAVLLAACAGPSQLQTVSGDTAPQPVVVQVPVEVSTPELRDGCWVQFYPDHGFRGDVATLVGPAELESADQMTGRHLKRDIDSLVTGSRATLHVYEHAMFKDREIVFGPSSRVNELVTKLGVGGRIESLRLECAN